MTVTFPHKTLPWLLIAPQLLVTLIFFLWPAGQAIEQAFYQEDPFGLSREFVGLENFIELLQDPSYYNSIAVTFVFSLSVALSGLVIALVLATMADRIIRGQMG